MSMDDPVFIGVLSFLIGATVVTAWLARKRRGRFVDRETPFDEHDRAGRGSRGDGV